MQTNSRDQFAADCLAEVHDAYQAGVSIESAIARCATVASKRMGRTITERTVRGALLYAYGIRVDACVDAEVAL